MMTAYPQVSMPRGGLGSLLQCVMPVNFVGPQVSHPSSTHPCSATYVTTAKSPSNVSTCSPSSGSESSTFIHPALVMRRIITLP